MPVSKLLNLPYGSYLMVRLDYVVICGDELEAKIMRIIEMYMDDERRILYKAFLNDPKNDVEPEATIEITRDVWVAISHRLFKNDLYDQDMSENTLKRAIKSLAKKQFIKVRDDRSKRYEAPKYQINIEKVQAELNTLSKIGKSEYQKLMVSKIDGIKNASHQNMTPGDHQILTPSSNSMVSKFDPNSRRITGVDSGVEEDTYTAPSSIPAPSDADASTHARAEQDDFHVIGEFIAEHGGYHHPSKPWLKWDSLNAPSVICADLTGDPAEDVSRKAESIRLRDHLSLRYQDIELIFESPQGKYHDLAGNIVDPLDEAPYRPDYTANQSTSQEKQVDEQQSTKPPVQDVPRTAEIKQAELSTPAVEKPAESVEKPKRTRAKKAAEPELAFTEQGRKVYDAWCSLFRSPPRAAEKTIDCANELASQLIPWCKDLKVPCKDMLDEIRRWEYATDAEFYRKRGVTLCDIGRDFERWQSAKTEELERTKKPASHSRKGNPLDEMRQQQQRYAAQSERIGV